MLHRSPAHRRLIVDRPSSRAEIVIGRALAASVHPTAAWRVLPPSRRALIAFGYFAAAYVTVLALLQVL